MADATAGEHEWRSWAAASVGMSAGAMASAGTPPRARAASTTLAANNVFDKMLGQTLEPNNG
jgi:hypothetical protein